MKNKNVNYAKILKGRIYVLKLKKKKVPERKLLKHWILGGIKEIIERITQKPPLYKVINDKQFEIIWQNGSKISDSFFLQHFSCVSIDFLKRIQVSVLFGKIKTFPQQTNLSRHLSQFWQNCFKWLLF